ncbi:MAG: AMP-binding protein [Bacteroidetes bacterium]|nr:AMP-binding protein [Bacteroidota bacterium]MBL7105484.1 AMP-binding protein [Bacteroidales bacterium]
MKFLTFVQDYLKNTSELFPNKEALIFGNERWTYSSIDRSTDFLGISLLDLGIQRQDRIVIFLDNSTEIVLSLYGILKAAGVFVIINGSVQAQKLSYILKDSGARILITHTSKNKVVSNAISNLKLDNNFKIIWVGAYNNMPQNLILHSIRWHELFKNKISQENIRKKLMAVRAGCIDIDLAALIYTSGSTGEPKGVMTTHQNMISAARSIIEYLENTENDIILNTLPLSFDYGLYQIIMAFMFGGSVVLEKSFIFFTNIIQRLINEKVTGFPIVPTIIAMILKSVDLKKYDLSALRYISNTGAALPVDHIQKLRKILPHVSIYSMFGLTECKRISYLPPEEIDKRPSSVGKAMPNCEVFIVNKNEEEVKPGEVGELVVRGANVMKGYWNSPKLTSKVFRPGLGFDEKLLFTGDYFKMDDDGFLYFLERKDDMIKSRGERISAKEIENILYQIEEVNECAVIGIPDEIFGQAIKAFIVKTTNSKLKEKDILNYCFQHLEPFSIPKYVKFLDELPKNPHGKVDKKILL